MQEGGGRRKMQISCSCCLPLLLLSYLDLYWNVIRVSSSNTNGRTKR